MIQKAMHVDYGNSQQRAFHVFKRFMLEQTPNYLYAIDLISVDGSTDKKAAKKAAKKAKKEKKKKSSSSNNNTAADSTSSDISAWRTTNKIVLKDARNDEEGAKITKSLSCNTT